MSGLSFGAVAQAERVQDAVRNFCDTLSRATALAIQPRLLPSYAELIALSVQGEIDLAWAPPLVAVELENQSAAVALVAVSRSMRSAYHSVLFTLASSSIERVEDIQRATVAWVSPESASGYFVPRWHLRSIGASLERCFAKEIFFQSHHAVVQAVLSGEADLGATHVALEPVTGQLARASWQRQGVSSSAIRVLLLIGPIPGDVITAGPHVPINTRQRLAAALLSMRDVERSSAFDATRFEPVADGHLRLLKGLRAHAVRSEPE